MESSYPTLRWSEETAEETVRRAVEVLRGGGLVALPTETVYGIAAMPGDASSLQRLRELKGRDQKKPLSLAFANRDAVVAFGLNLSPQAMALAEKYWPGPLTLVLPDAEGHSAGARVPAAAPMQRILEALGSYVFLTSANLSGQADATTAQEVQAAFADGLDLLVDGGECPIRQPSTVVRVAGRGVEVLREGLITEEMVFRCAGRFVLLVCTGNTCRSPMAEALLRGMIADRMGISPERLLKHGVRIESAGTSALPGYPISPEAIATVREHGMEIDASKRSQPLSAELVEGADRIYTMTSGHRASLLERFPDVEGKVELLHRDGGNIADPIGGGKSVYAQCAKEMLTHLDKVADQI